jgi:type II secretory pathway component PulJ
MAFTLMELMIAGGVGTCILAGLMTGAMALQRGYSAAHYQLQCQEDQLRVIDFITQDLRRATSVTISNQNRRLILTLPDQLDKATSLLRTPVIEKGVVRYVAPSTAGTPPPAPATVAYYISGTAFVRQVDGKERVISTNPTGLEGFFVYNDTPDVSPPLVRFTISFVPTFSRRGGVDRGAANRCSAVVRLRNKANVLVL